MSAVIINFNQYRAKTLAEAFVSQMGIEVEGEAIDFAVQLHNELKENFGSSIQLEVVVEDHWELFRMLDEKILDVDIFDPDLNTRLKKTP